LKKIFAYKYFVYTLACLFFSREIFAQPLFTNNSAVIWTAPMALVAVNGDLHNVDTSITNNGQFLINGNFTNDGLAQGNGVWEVMGNWINNSSFLCGTSNVNLRGGPQLITGTQQTIFYNLNLSGIGIKTMTLNAFVTHHLNLTDRELATDVNTIFVTNIDSLAVSNTTGFVSSLANGSLSRNTAYFADYFFPVGSSLGINRYRPVNINPNKADSNTYTVRFVNNNPTLDGYDVNNKDTTLCLIDSFFYHRINRTAGVDTASITIFYVPTDDGNWNAIANWKPLPANQWQSMGLGTMQTIPMVGVTRWNWGDFSTDPYALAAVLPSAPQIYGDASICSNDPIQYYQTWGDTSLIYVWNVVGGTIVGDTDQNAILVQWDSAGVGIITLQVISPFGNCISPASAFITVVSQSPVANYSYLDSTNLFTFDLIAFTDLSSNAVTWQWNFSDGLMLAQQNPYHVFENIGTYPVTLIVTSANGCSDTIVKNIEIIQGVESPNVFTPNADGYNDYFYVRASGIIVYNLKIFNRWGLLMFESNSPSARWDGKTQGGNEAPDGTYFYTLIAKSSDQDYSRTGTVTLIR